MLTFSIGVTGCHYFAKPALIHVRFLDALQDPGSKIRASVESSAIFMKDQPNQIKNKINKYAFSGVQGTGAEQRELGAIRERRVVSVLGILHGRR